MNNDWNGRFPPWWVQWGGFLFHFHHREKWRISPGQEMMLMFQNICNGDNIVFIPHKEASVLRLCSWRSHLSDLFPPFRTHQDAPGEHTVRQSVQLRVSSLSCCQDHRLTSCISSQSPLQQPYIVSNDTHTAYLALCLQPCTNFIIIYIIFHPAKNRHFVRSFTKYSAR